MPQGENSADPLLGLTVAGKYKIVSAFGSGGTSTVYLAQHESLQRMVAIKVMREGFFTNDSTLVKRFQLEASATKALEHDNIVRIYAIGQLPDSLTMFLVLEHLQGGSLADALEQHGSLPLELCWSIFEQLSAGLAHAHAKNIIHRDIKPGNLMFSETLDLKNPGTCRLKLVDFGISKLMESETLQKLTQTGALLGTPLYMSPEQLLGTKTSAAADVYSAGCVMYECLFGKTPFTGHSYLEIALKQTELAVTIPETLPDGRAVPVGLRALLLKALAKTPNKRISDGQQLLDWVRYVRLQPHLVPDPLKQTAGRPSRSPLVPPIPKLRIPPKIVAIGLGVMIPIAGFSYQFFDKVVQRERAEKGMRASIQDAASNCRSLNLEAACADLEEAQAQANKFPALQTEVNNGVIEATKVTSGRLREYNANACWLLNKATKVPFNAQDPLDVEQHLRYLCLLETCALNLANNRDSKADVYFGYIADSAPSLVELFGKNKFKPIAELQQAVTAVLAAGANQGALALSSPDEATKKLHLERQKQLVRNSLDILEHVSFNPARKNPTYNFEDIVPLYVNLLFTTKDFAAVEAYGQHLMTSPTCTKQLSKSWYLPPFWESLALIDQHKDSQAAEHLLQEIVARDEKSKVKIPRTGITSVYMFLAVAQQQQLHKEQNAIASLNRAIQSETGSAKPNQVFIAQAILRKADIYRTLGDFSAANKQLDVADEHLFGKSPEASLTRDFKVSLETRIKNRDRAK